MTGEEEFLNAARGPGPDPVAMGLTRGSIGESVTTCPLSVSISGPVYTQAAGGSSMAFTTATSSAGGNAMSAGASDVGSQQVDQNLAAIRDTCKYVATIMENFNADIESLAPDAQDCIRNLNAKLGEMLVNPTPVLAETHGNHVEKGVSDVAEPGNTLPSSIRKQSCIDSSEESDSGARLKPSVVKHSVRFSPVKQEISYRSEAGANIGVSDQPPPLSAASHALPGGALSIESVLQALSRLDNRSVPKPERFDSRSGQDFNQYLRTFEEYCQFTFRGGSTLWIGELGRLLEDDDEMHSVFEALKVPGDTYASLKQKLLRWRQDTWEVLEAQTKSRFTKSYMQPGETLRLYAAKLEKSFRLAYPQRNIEHSRTLRQKYSDTVPRSFAKVIHSARSMHKSLMDREIMWKDILALASQHDAAGDLVKETPEEIQLNYSQNYGQPGSVVRRSVTPYYSGDVHMDERPSRYDVWQNSAQNQAAGHRFGSVPARPPFANATNTPNQRPVSVSRDAARNPGSSGDPTCFYCDKPGHMKSQCWRFLKLCLICGSDQHFIAGCDKRRRASDLQTSTARGSASDNAAGANQTPLGLRSAVAMDRTLVFGSGGGTPSETDRGGVGSAHHDDWRHTGARPRQTPTVPLNS